MGAGQLMVIVTGASRGTGAATARLAARRGYAVCINYHRHREVADAVVYVDYAASKGALDTLTIGLSREVAGEGIRVNWRPIPVITEVSVP